MAKGFYGLMTEEINHSYDGDLYGELIQNRALSDDPVRVAEVAFGGGRDAHLSRLLGHDPPAPPRVIIET